MLTGRGASGACRSTGDVILKYVGLVWTVCCSLLACLACAGLVYLGVGARCVLFPARLACLFLLCFACFVCGDVLTLSKRFTSSSAIRADTVHVSARSLPCSYIAARCLEAICNYIGADEALPHFRVSAVAVDFRDDDWVRCVLMCYCCRKVFKRRRKLPSSST